MGPYGPLLFVVTVACAELIPLFPTQPLSLASGLLFGPRLVRLLVLTTCLSEVHCCAAEVSAEVQGPALYWL